MKPDDRQIKVLQEYLQNTLTYRECYEEIYDHILSALEQQPDTINFEDAINNVIVNDFGSPQNLLKIEKASKDALVKDSINTYIKYLLYYIKLPGLFYTIIIALLSYYIFSQYELAPKVILGVFAMLVFFPGVILMMRLYFTGYVLDTTRKSAKDKLFEHLAGLPIRISLIPVFVLNMFHYKLWQGSNNYLITFFFVLGIFYNIALYKLYKREFNAFKA